MDNNLKSIIQKALQLDKFSIAKLISIFEDQRAEANLKRNEIIQILKNSDQHHTGIVLGLTGTPGAGKSTLVGKLATQIIDQDPNFSVAVLAIDPSSEISGGALLGDRTRVSFPLSEQRLFFRSQSSSRELGGISPSTFQVCRLLYYLFDVIFIETVGIGQNEIEIKNLADKIMLVLQPLGGDQIQFMKAGIMEIPDLFIINKCDEVSQAKKSYYSLKSSLDFVRPDENNIPILQTSALKNKGLDEVIQFIMDQKNNITSNILDKEPYFLEKWIRQEYGKWGIEQLKEKFQGSRELLKLSESYDIACNKYTDHVLRD